MAKTRIKPSFLNLPPGSRVQGNRGKSEGLSPLGSSSESRIKPGFFLYLTLLISLAWGQRLLCCPKRGTFVPPFFVYGKAGPTVLATPLGRRAPPYNPQLLKKLAKLLLVSPKPKRGPLASRPPQTPAPLSAGLGCRLGCCLPVADAQHRPKWQRRPVLNGPHRGPGPRLESPGTGRGRALTVSTGAAVAAAP